MKLLNRILLVYKGIVPFTAFLVIAILLPEKTTLLAATGWICALLFTTVYMSRFVANERSKSELIWEILSIFLVVASIVLRDNGNFETYFIEVTLINFASLAIGLLIFQIYKMASIDKGEWKAGAIIVVALIIGYPVYYFTNSLILGWFELNTIHQDPTPFILLLAAVLTNIVREIRFFQSLINGKANYKMDFLDNNKWLIAVILGGWVVVVPLLAWLIR